MNNENNKGNSIYDKYVQSVSQGDNVVHNTANSIYSKRTSTSPKGNFITEQERLRTYQEVKSYKSASEANVIFSFYKTPELLYDYPMTVNDFVENMWRVYYQIASDIILLEKKTVLDDITIGVYLEKHPKLKEKYEEYGGYTTVNEGRDYINANNVIGYMTEFHKWNTVLQLMNKSFPITEANVKKFCDMSLDDIYENYEAMLNHVFVNVASEVKSYNACEGLNELIDKLNAGANIGLPLDNCEILNNEIGGINCNGNIYGLGAASGVGKSTTVMTYLIPSIIEYNEKAVFFINEEDVGKVQQEMIIWVANNIFSYDLPKYKLRNGNYDEKTLKELKDVTKWLEDKRLNQNITVIPLEQYSVNTVVRLIRKYTSLGVRYFVLDTLKESCDARTDEIYKSMTRDMVKLYDVVKPASKNVALFVTYQLGKASIKTRYLTNNEIGMAKSIVDVMSVNLMIRRPFEDEYEGGRHEITGYKIEGTKKSKIPFKLKRDKHYMITFIPKNRFGQTDAFQIISEFDLSINRHKDIGICNIIQDW